MREMSDHQRNVAQALEGNERIFFHPFEDRIAVWYGQALIKIFDSQTWEQVDNKRVPLAHKPDTDLSDVESAVVVSLAADGYERKGRSRTDSELVEA